MKSFITVPINIDETSVVVAGKENFSIAVMGFAVTNQVSNTIKFQSDGDDLSGPFALDNYSGFVLPVTGFSYLETEVSKDLSLHLLANESLGGFLVYRFIRA